MDSPWQQTWKKRKKSSRPWKPGWLGLALIVALNHSLLSHQRVILQIRPLLISLSREGKTQSITVHNQRTYQCGFNLQASYTAEPCSLASKVTLIKSPPRLCLSCFQKLQVSFCWEEYQHLAQSYLKSWGVEQEEEGQRQQAVGDAKVLPHVCAINSEFGCQPYVRDGSAEWLPLDKRD